jgi:hypothetical protein
MANSIFQKYKIGYYDNQSYSNEQKKIYSWFTRFALISAVGIFLLILLVATKVVVLNTYALIIFILLAFIDLTAGAYLYNAIKKR